MKSKYVYYPDSDGGFIGSEDGQTQILDFRQGAGDVYGEIIASLLNENDPFTAAVMQCSLYKMQLTIAMDALEHIARHGGECSTDEHARVAIKKIKEMEK